MRLVAAVVLFACVLVGQEPQGFRYRVGDVYVAVEQTMERETDDRLGYAIATSHVTERRYTVLAVGVDGSADVLVEQRTGPQQLHEYLIQGTDTRAAYTQKGFDAGSTVKQRVLVAKFTRLWFRCEPARDEPAVFYLQELPELVANALTWPADGGLEWRVVPELPRLKAAMAMKREGNEVRGELSLAITDPRVSDGKEVACLPGRVEWRRDPETLLPRNWRVELRYPRFPINRPNVRTVTGELFQSTALNAVELAGLRADLDAFTAVRDALFAGRFTAGLEAAAAFTALRPKSRLLPAVEAEVAAFRQQVPRFGEVLPEPLVAHWFGGEPATLAKLRGKVVVLDFWATWCVPCVAGMEHLIKAQASRGEKLCVLGLTRVDPKQSVDDVRAFRETGYAAGHGGLAVNYPFVVLGDNATHDWFKVRAIPVLVVLDREGKVCWQQTGSGGQARLDRVLAAALEQRLEELLAGLKGVDLHDEQQLKTACEQVAAERSAWQGTRFEAQFRAKNKLLRETLDSLIQQREVRERLVDMDRALADPTLESLARQFELARDPELLLTVAQLGGEPKTRFDTAAAALTRRYLAELETAVKACADATTGAGLLALGMREDALTTLADAARAADDAGGLATWQRLLQQARADSDRTVVKLFDAAWLERQPWRNPLNEVDGWLVTASPSFTFKFGGDLALNNVAGEDSRSGALTFGPASGWRDYVLHAEVRLSSGAMTLYARAAGKLDSKYVPSLFINPKDAGSSFRYDRVHSVTMSVIGSTLAITVDGAELRRVELAEHMSRKGSMAIAVRPGTEAVITRLRVRQLR